jgi:CRP/FNR family cyclic AMP-dependent transcriptional regulator
MATTLSKAGDLASRFRDKTALENAIVRQTISGGNFEVARQLAKIATVQSYEQNEVLIRQGETDTHFFLILSGSVIISPNGRDDTTRRAHSHVGEMATIDPAVRRSATVRAGEATVVARISESEFSKVADSYPFLWRRIALELAERLRQRADGVATRAETPRVFIASSSEALGIATALNNNLTTHPKLEVKLWSDGVFTPGTTNIEALEEELKVADFAAIVLSAQ